MKTKIHFLVLTIVFFIVGACNPSKKEANSDTQTGPQPLVEGRYNVGKIAETA